jgi:acetolactate synthase-1/3 small subunit
MATIIVASARNTLQALNRVVSLLRGRDFLVESISVARSERSDVSRLAIVVDETRTRPARVTSCLEKLEEVWSTRLVERSDMVRREAALVKVDENTVRSEVVSALVQSGVARLIDRSDGTAIVEVLGFAADVDDVIGSLPPASILEIARGGQLVMARGRERTTLVTPP